MDFPRDEVGRLQVLLGLVGRWEQVLLLGHLLSSLPSKLSDIGVAVSQFYPGADVRPSLDSLTAQGFLERSRGQYLLEPDYQWRLSEAGAVYGSPASWLSIHASVGNSSAPVQRIYSLPRRNSVQPVVRFNALAALGLSEAGSPTMSHLSREVGANVQMMKSAAIYLSELGLVDIEARVSSGGVAGYLFVSTPGQSSPDASRVIEFLQREGWASLADIHRNTALPNQSIYDALSELMHSKSVRARGQIPEGYRYRVTLTEPGRMHVTDFVRPLSGLITDKALDVQRPSVEEVQRYAALSSVV